MLYTGALLSSSCEYVSIITKLHLWHLSLPLFDFTLNYVLKCFFRIKCSISAIILIYTCIEFLSVMGVQYKCCQCIPNLLSPGKYKKYCGHMFLILLTPTIYFLHRGYGCEPVILSFILLLTCFTSSLQQLQQCSLRVRPQYKWL